MRGSSLWGPGKGPKKFGEKYFDKSIGKCVCCEAYVVPPWRLVYLVNVFQISHRVVYASFSDKLLSASVKLWCAVPSKYL